MHCAMSSSDLDVLCVAGAVGGGGGTSTVLARSPRPAVATVGFTSSPNMCAGTPCMGPSSRSAAVTVRAYVVSSLRRHPKFGFRYPALNHFATCSYANGPCSRPCGSM